jgi:cytochrome P450
MTGGDPGERPTELYWDPFDVEIDADPYRIWERMRDEQPVYRNDRYDFWALTRFADVEAAHKDHRSFSSAHGTVLELMSPEPGLSDMMIFLDPPEHTQLRSLVSRAFTPRRVSGLESDVRRIACELLAPWRDGEPFDFVEDFAAQLPSLVITTLMGVPDADRLAVKHLIDTVFHIEPGVGMVNDVSLNAGIELHHYLRAQIEERVRSPRDDLLTDLGRAEITDEHGEVRRLTTKEAANFANLLTSAGTETVARLLGWAGVLLDRHPEQRAELAADPTLIPSAVEELLRYEPPSPVQGRWLTREVTMHGVTIPADSKVLLLTGAAGRDERKYPDADRFDVHRRFPHHVSFGYGIHFCLGAALARLEGRVGLEEALAAHPTWTVDHDRCVRLHTSTVRGWVSVPVAA